MFTFGLLLLYSKTEEAIQIIINKYVGLESVQVLLKVEGLAARGE